MCACIQISTVDVEARSLSKHQGNTTCDASTMRDVLASWSNAIREPPSQCLTYKCNMHCKPLSLSPIRRRHLLGDWYAIVGIGLEACVRHYNNSARRPTNFITVARWSGPREADCSPVLASLSESRQGPLIPRRALWQPKLATWSETQPPDHLVRATHHPDAETPGSLCHALRQPTPAAWSDT